MNCHKTVTSATVLCVITRHASFRHQQPIQLFSLLLLKLFPPSLQAAAPNASSTPSAIRNLVRTRSRRKSIRNFAKFSERSMRVETGSEDNVPLDQFRTFLHLRVEVRIADDARSVSYVTASLIQPLDCANNHTWTSQSITFYVPSICFTHPCTAGESGWQRALKSV